MRHRRTTNTAHRRCLARGHRSECRGSTTVEFAIATALMVTLLLAIVQVGVWFHLRAVAHTAARHGLDEVRVVDGTTDDAITTANVFLEQSGSGIRDRTVTAARTETTAAVRITGTVVAIVPGLHLPLDVRVDAPVERPAP